MCNIIDLQSALALFLSNTNYGDYIEGPCLLCIMSLLTSEEVMIFKGHGEDHWFVGFLSLMMKKLTIF
jgi:hypothetical protein